MIGKALATWVAMLAVAVGLGALRDALLTPRLGAHRAHQLGSLAVCAVFAMVSRLFVAWAGPTRGQALAVGAAWLVLVLAFEFCFFHLVRGVPLTKLLADYNVFAGRLWPLVLLTVLLAPWLFAAGR
jgi:hypothetical protein